MAGPLNGLGTGQQIPLSNTFQPGQNNVRSEEDRKDKENLVQPRRAESAQSQKAETESQNAARASQQASNQNQSLQDNTSRRRGSVVDITV